MAFTKKFVADALERAVKTFAQALVGVFVGNVTVANVGWAASLAVAGTAALVSVLTSVASTQVGSDPDSASVL
jgi:hypothetical protein